jgi:DNA helicase-2/ATP-dependent DNA helicase PcrA
MIDSFHEKFQKFLATHLNNDQRQAVIPREGVFLVRAGAGSGKTRVITTRIVHLLLEHEEPANSIVALTFTNKAAQEMRERVIHALPPNIKYPIISTFHSYGLQILKQHGALIELPQFSIIDSDDREKLIQSIIKRHNVAKRVTATAMSSAISRHKNSITSVHKNHIRDSWTDPLYHQIWYEYEKERKAARCLDFDDLLVETLRLFETQQEFKKRMQRNVRHVLVDEYQDTNKLQHALIQQIGYTNNNDCSLTSLCVVGDENQAIYSWRGATVDNMTRFKEDFPGTTTVSITQNYRSVQPILQTANQVIAHNKHHATHKIWSDRSATNRVLFATCANAYQEGELLALCGSYFQKAGTLSRLAVLYRSHFQSRALEEALVRNSIPYIIVGGTQFYDRQEIKDILAYLRLAHNPFDRISFTRCINTPSRTLGDAFVEQVMDIWNSSPDYSIFETAHELIKSDALPPRKKEAFQQFIAIIQQISGAATARAALTLAIEKTAFFPHLLKSYDPEEANERIANVQELVNAVAAMEERGITTVSAFLDEVALVQDNRSNETTSNEVVRLMTLHGAKGLEFDTVMITGLEEGIFPSMQSSYNDTSLEEERRLLYVGITRARERLFMTCATSRFLFGTLRDQRPSRFIKEFPSDHVHHLDGEATFFLTIQQRVNAWLHAGAASKSDPTVIFSKKVHSPQQKQAIIPSVKFDDPFVDEEPTTKSATSAKPPTSPAAPSTLAWRLQQKVQHPTFGEGTILGIESHTAITYLIIQFKAGLKKIASSFVRHT